MKKGIIFDMDGTLWDSAENVANAWNEVLRDMGYMNLVITREDMYRVMGKTMDVIAEILFPDIDNAQREDILKKCCQKENDYLRSHGGILYPELVDTLKELSNGYNLYIVSNCQSGYIEAFLDYYKLWDLFLDIECFGNNGLQKGDNIRKLVERNNLDTAVYVGDIQGDYDASKAAGVSFIHAAYGFGTIDEEVTAINTFKDLIIAVEKELH